MVCGFSCFLLCICLISADHPDIGCIDVLVIGLAHLKPFEYPKAWDDQGCRWQQD